MAPGDTRPARFALRPAGVRVGGALRGETKAANRGTVRVTGRFEADGELLRDGFAALDEGQRLVAGGRVGRHFDVELVEADEAGGAEFTN